MSEMGTESVSVRVMRIVAVGPFLCPLSLYVCVRALERDEEREMCRRPVPLRERDRESDREREGGRGERERESEREREREMDRPVPLRVFGPQGAAGACTTIRLSTPSLLRVICVRVRCQSAVSRSIRARERER